MSTDVLSLTGRIRTCLVQLADVIGAERACLCLVEQLDAEYVVVDFVSGGIDAADPLGPAFLGSSISDIPEWSAAFRSGKRATVRSRDGMSPELASRIGQTNLDWVVTSPLGTETHPLGTLSLVGRGSARQIDRRWDPLFETVAEVMTSVLTIQAQQRLTAANSEVNAQQSASLERQRTALDMVGCGVVWIDEFGELLHLNAAATRTLAIGAVDARQRGATWDTFRPSLVSGEPATVAILAALRSVTSLELELTDATGARQQVLLESHPPLLQRWSGRREQLLLLRQYSGPAEPEATEAPTLDRPSVLEGVALTGREREIVELLLRGYRVSSIAPRLFLSTHTIRNHLKSVFRKAGVTSQGELIELARVAQTPL